MHNRASVAPCISALTYRAFLHNLCAMQTVAPEVIAVEKDASDNGVIMARVLAAAAVSQSTWFRWRHKGIEPRMATFRKVRSELDRMIGSNDPTPSQTAA